jgi:hypothetical protein
MVGSAIWRTLTAKVHTNLIRALKELDLRNQQKQKILRPKTGSTIDAGKKWEDLS